MTNWPGIDADKGNLPASHNGDVNIVVAFAEENRSILVRVLERVVGLGAVKRELGLQVGSIAVAQVKATNVSLQLPVTR